MVGYWSAGLPVVGYWSVGLPVVGYWSAGLPVVGYWSAGLLPVVVADQSDGWYFDSLQHSTMIKADISHTNTHNIESVSHAAVNVRK